MAKSITLQPGGRHTSNQATIPVAPPAQIPGVPTLGSALRDGPPLPIGQLIKGNKMTPAERTMLENVGWQEGEPVPENLAELVYAAQAEVDADLAEAAGQLPIDPSTPATNFKLVGLDSLPPEKQAEVRHNMAAALAANQNVRPSAPLSETAQKVAKSKQLNVELPPPARPATRTSIDPNYKPTAAAINPKAKAPEPTQQAAGEIRMSEPIAPLEHCPHCEWDLTVPSDIEPSDDEKNTFVASIIGEKSFIKKYTLLGGKLELTFRTLAPKELDACFQQVNRDQDRREIETYGDRWEKINRYRLFLQLQRVTSSGTFDHDMPDGLSAKHNKYAEEPWVFPDGTDEPLKAIEEYMTETVLLTETVFRLTQQTCGQFNKLVAKLEAMTKNSDFWNATGSQSS